MNNDIKRIEYRCGMFGDGAKTDELPIKTWGGAEMPDDLLKAIHDEGILDLGGVYGEKDAGDPIQYDQLRLILSHGVVEIEFFNRGIMLLFTDDERFRRIHRVLCKLAGPRSHNKADCAP